MSEIIIKNEVHFCEMDSVAGDGDFGMSIAKGFRQLKADWLPARRQHRRIPAQPAEIIKEYCGGASGPIWGSAFMAAGKAAGEAKEIGTAELADMAPGSRKSHTGHWRALLPDAARS